MLTRSSFSSTSSASTQQPASSPPLTSISDRMAALRAHGLSGTKAAPRAPAPRPLNAPPVSYVPPPAPASSIHGSQRTTASGTSSHSPLQRSPDLPPKPSPPPSPRTRMKGDLVEDSAGQRSGSAPPSIPVLDTGDLSTFGGVRDQLGGALPSSEGDERCRRGSGPAEGSPTPRYGQLSSLPSPTDFSSNFPSIDDFEKSAPGSSSPSNGDYAFPSVPSSLPSASPNQARISLPPPPRPFEMDTQAMDEERRQQSAAAASLGGGIMQRTTSRERDDPSSTNRLPPSLVAGGGRSSSTQPPSAPTPSHSPRPPLPPPTASSSKNFNIPFTAEVTPVALFSYLQSAQAESGKGPRVLLLDVRSREEYERGRVIGETVCLEPVVLRPG